MPLERKESFIARLQKNNRIQLPVLIRWKYKLDPGEIFHVRVENSEWEYFYARLSRDGRLTVPKIVIGKLGIKPGDIVEVVLLPENPD